MDDFHTFINSYLSKWKAADLNFMEKVIDNSFMGIEIRDGITSSHGKEESIAGWKQAFDYFKDKEMEWILTPMSQLPLKEKEVMVIIRATMTLDGKLIDTSNLFFQTFKKEDNEWSLIRTYEETGVCNP